MISHRFRVRFTLPVTGKGSQIGRVLLRRNGTVPPLPWSTFALPFALRESRSGKRALSAPWGASVASSSRAVCCTLASRLALSRLARSSPSMSPLIEFVTSNASTSRSMPALKRMSEPVALAVARPTARARPRWAQSRCADAGSGGEVTDSRASWRIAVRACAHGHAWRRAGTSGRVPWCGYIPVRMRRTRIRARGPSATSVPSVVMTRSSTLAMPQTGGRDGESRPHGAQFVRVPPRNRAEESR